jgi:hypothetical protein
MGCLFKQMLLAVLVQRDRHKVFKGFKPFFPNSHPSLAQASALNVAFVFQKRVKDPAPEGVPPQNGEALRSCACEHCLVKHVVHGFGCAAESPASRVQL